MDAVEDIGIEDPKFHIHKWKQKNNQVIKKGNMYFYIMFLEVNSINIPTSKTYKENTLQNFLKNKLLMFKFFCLGLGFC